MIDIAAIFNANILIVDDQEVNVNLLKEILMDGGYVRVNSTMDPLEVCALHRKHQYDLILLDLQMPKMDGFEVMEGLKANAISNYIPVLVITAQPGHKLRALLAGAKDFISKPFDLAEIKARVHNLLEVRLLYKALENNNKMLEERVQERTAELRESEARYRSLTELASDWYWEQDDEMNFTKVSGPVLEMLGIRVNSISLDEPKNDVQSEGWDESERASLQAAIAARRPFLNFIFHRTLSNGLQQIYQVSGEPMFNGKAKFIGYRGIGIELTNS
jgi:CheY-like chemotaxis protein